MRCATAVDADTYVSDSRTGCNTEQVRAVTHILSPAAACLPVVQYRLLPADIVVFTAEALFKQDTQCLA